MRLVSCVAMLGALVLGNLACAPAPPPVVPANLAPEAAQGRMLLSQKGCAGCHAIPGVVGASGGIGPSLAGVGSRTALAGGDVPNNVPEDMERWILDPPAVKPGTNMPKLNLTQDEARQMSAYLETLK